MMSRSRIYLPFVLMLLLCNCLGTALAATYDDFSTPYLKKSRWVDIRRNGMSENEYVREIESGEGVLNLKLGTNLATDLSRVNLRFIDPSAVDAIRANIEVADYNNDPTDSATVFARIGGFFYNSASSSPTDATGDIWAEICIGDRGAGLEAWYEVEQVQSANIYDSIQISGNQLIAGLSSGTAYTLELVHDPDPAVNSFDFKISQGATLLGEFVYIPGPTDPASMGPVFTQFKALSACVHDTFGEYEDGYINAEFDDVWVNAGSGWNLYDDFSDSEIDESLWSDVEYVKDAQDGHARLYTRGADSRQQSRIRLLDKYAPYLQATVNVDSSSWFSSGAHGRARLSGYYFNAIHGPGSYNGREGDAFVMINLVYTGGSTAQARAWVGYSNVDESSYTDEFAYTFPTPVAVDTDNVLSIDYTGTAIVFKCNAETITYTLPATVYPPSVSIRNLESRAYLSSGQTGYMKATFDDVVVADPDYTHLSGTWEVTPLSHINSCVAEDPGDPSNVTLTQNGIDILVDTSDGRNFSGIISGSVTMLQSSWMEDTEHLEAYVEAGFSNENTASGGFIANTTPSGCLITEDLVLARVIRTLTMATAGSGSGSTSPAVGDHAYDLDEVVTVSASADTGSTFTGWSGPVDEPGAATTAVTMSADATVTANFAINQYTLTMATTGTGIGSIAPAVGTHTYNYGDVVTITATAGTESTFGGWTGLVDDTGAATTTVTITGNTTVTAAFNLNQYTLTVATTGTGVGGTAPAAGDHTYDYGEVVTISATAGTGSSFSSWTGPVADAGAATTTVTITGDTTVTAAFNLNQYTLTMATSGTGSGSVTPAEGGHTYNYGEVVMVTASAATGSQFTGWSGSVADSGSATTTVTITDDTTLTANFDLGQYALTMVTSGSGNGTISPVAGIYAYDYGEVVTITATAGKESTFGGWTGPVADAGAATTTVTITGDTTVTAAFNLNQYTLTMATSGTGVGGTTPPAGDHTYDYGEVVTISATAGTGSSFSSWTGPVADAGAATTTVTITGDTTVTAAFNLNQYTLTMATSGTGSGSLSPEVGTYTYTYGQVVAITATAGTETTFAGWTGPAADPSAAATTVTIHGDTTVTAAFNLNQYTLTMATTGTGSGVVTPAAGTHTYNYGEVVAVTAAAGTGSSFGGWTGPVGDAGSAATTVTITGDTTLTAAFSLNQYTLTMATSGTGNGTVAPGVGDHTYDYGEVVTVSATAAANSTFGGWTGPVADASAATTTVTINGDTNLTAEFLSDTDGDGISDAEEMGPDGTDPTFSGDDDPTPDYQQPGATSCHTYDGTAYVTLAVDTGVLVDVTAIANPSPGDAPDATFGWDFFQFKVTGITPGGSVAVSLHLPAGDAPTNYYKYGPTAGQADHWYSFEYDTVAGVGAEYNGDVVTLHLTDGADGDDDLSANGEITDAGGPAIQSVTPAGGGPGSGSTGSSGGGGGGGGCFIQSIH